MQNERNVSLCKQQRLLGFYSMALPTGFQIRDKGFPLSALEYWARQARLRLSQRLSRILVKHQVPKVSIHGSLFDSLDIESWPLMFGLGVLISCDPHKLQKNFKI